MKKMSSPTKMVRTSILATNIAVVAMMFFTGYSYLFNPETFPLLAPLGMIFPLFMVLTALFMLFWVFVKIRYALLSLVALIACYGPVHLYIGINKPAPPPEIGLKVMTYNVLGFHGTEENPMSRDSNLVAQLIIDSGCHLVCLQESGDGWLSMALRDSMAKAYPHHIDMTRKSGGDCVSLYSKFPILKADTIPYTSAANLSAAFTVMTPNGPVLVVNNHLETNSLSMEDQKRFRNMVDGEFSSTEMREESKTLYRKLAEAMAKRAPQARAVADYVERYKDMPVILCGDFNDTPLSYVHHVIGRQLTDCFAASGRGLGWTYCRNAMRVRIDNIFCSSHFRPLRTEVLSDYRYSDHYPVVSWLEYANGGSKEAENKEKTK